LVVVYGPPYVTRKLSGGVFIAFCCHFGERMAVEERVVDTVVCWPERQMATWTQSE
jgi:hypothetical protein